MTNTLAEAKARLAQAAAACLANKPGAAEEANEALAAVINARAAHKGLQSPFEASSGKQSHEGDHA